MFSRAEGRAGRCRQILVACVGSTHSVPSTLGLPPLTGVCSPRLHCSGSRLLYMEWALHRLRFQFLGPPQKCRLGWTCVLCLPHRSSSGSQELDRWTLPSAVCLLPSVVPASVSLRSGQVRLVSVLRNWPLAATLPVGWFWDHPESQEVFG